MALKKRINEDYKFLLPVNKSSWVKEMFLLLEDEKKFKVNIENEIELPYPMQDGKDVIAPGEYEVELSIDKNNYVWTNPETKERISFPIDLIKKEPEAPEQQEPSSEEQPQAEEGIGELSPPEGLENLGLPPV